MVYVDELIVSYPIDITCIMLLAYMQKLCYKVVALIEYIGHVIYMRGKQY